MSNLIEGAVAMDPGIQWEEILPLFKDDKLKKIVESAKELRILFAGKTGAGKSSLINALIGRKWVQVEMGVQDGGVSLRVESYTERIKGVKVTAYDSPGLQDGTGRDDEYLQEMYTKCKDVDLILFAVRIGDNRFVHGDLTVKSIIKFTKKFGTSVWKKTLFIVTCVNLMEVLNPDIKSWSYNEKKDFFRKEMLNTRQLLHKCLQEEAGVPEIIAKEVKVVPAGDDFQERLLDETLWLSNMWFECLSAIPTPESRVSLVKMSADRIKLEKSVTRADFEKPLDEQPIVVKRGRMSENTATVLTIGSVAGSAAVGGLVGALALIAGPIGLVGIPIGMFVGMMCGAAVAAYKNEERVKAKEA